MQWRISKTPIAVSVSKGLSQLPRPGFFLARSNSHSVAVRDGCTNIPLAAGRLRKTRPFLSSAVQAMPDFGSSTRIRQN
jgi:hypothetical protein